MHSLWLAGNIQDCKKQRHKYKQAGKTHCSEIGSPHLWKLNGEIQDAFPRAGRRVVIASFFWMSSVNSFGSESVLSPTMPLEVPGARCYWKWWLSQQAAEQDPNTNTLMKERRAATLFFSKSKNTLPVLWATSSSQITVNVQNTFHFCLGASRMSK